MNNDVRLGKPRRPFGLTLAMVAAVVTFTVVPLIEVLFVFAIQEVRVSVESGGMMGGAFIGFTIMPLLVQMLVSIVFFFITLVAARGKPARMQWVYPLVVVVVGVGFLLLRVLPISSSSSPEAGYDSLMVFRQTVLNCGLWIILGIIGFTVWFSRRWSVRAFFRGYYTPEDVEAMRAIGFSLPLQEAEQAG